MRVSLKKILCFAGLVCALYVFYSAVLMPVYSRVCSDVLYSDGILPGLLEFAAWLFDLVIFALVFGAFAGVAKAHGLRNAFAVLSSAVVTDLVSYAVSYIVYRGEFWSSFVVPLIFDVVQMLVGTLFAALIIKRKGSKIISAVFIPAALAIIAVKAGMRIRYDIFYGAPEDFIDAMWIIFYYASDVLSGVIVMQLSLLFSKMFSKSEV